MSKKTVNTIEQAAQHYNVDISLIENGNATFPSYVPNQSKYSPSDVAWYRYDKDGNVIFDNFDMSKYMNFVKQKYVSTQDRSEDWLIHRDDVNYVMAQGVLYGGRKTTYYGSAPNLTGVKARFVKSINDYRFDNVDLGNLFCQYKFKWITNKERTLEYQVDSTQLGEFLIDGFVLGRALNKKHRKTRKSRRRLINEMCHQYNSTYNPKYSGDYIKDIKKQAHKTKKSTHTIALSPYDFSKALCANLPKAKATRKTRTTTHETTKTAENDSASNVINVTINGTVNITANDNSTIKVSIKNNDQ